MISSVCHSLLIDRKRCHSVERRGRPDYLDGNGGVRMVKQQPGVLFEEAGLERVS